MADRDPALQAFLAGVRGALAAGPLTAAQSATVARIYGALSAPGDAGAGRGRRLPVCREWLPVAFAGARRHAPATARIIDALADIEPGLFWAPRAAGGPHASANWRDGHANATIIGPDGLERRRDLLVGVSLLAPHVRYPDHNHGPEEVYLVLSPGRFRHGGSGWSEPGTGGTFHNEPFAWHAMRADATPLLAIWHLWVGTAAPGA